MNHTGACNPAVLVVAAIGISNTGKTVTLEYLISQLSAQGYQVGAIKHVHHCGFTIDRVGSNTWRYAQAGSKVIVAVSPEEVDIIRKTEKELTDLDKILALLENEKLDIIFIEGFHSLIAKRSDIYKIITAKDEEGIQEKLEGTSEPILAIAGIVAKNLGQTQYGKIPVIRVPEEGERLVALVKAKLKSQS